MSTIIKTPQEFSTRNLLVLMIVTGLGLSVISFLILNEEIVSSSQDYFLQTNLQICKNGLCNTQTINDPEIGFVQQSSELGSAGNSVSNQELFSGLSLVKDSIQSKNPQIFGNKVTLFAEKDSFLREGVKNTNEGANEVLRVMGTGPTTNRAVISFSESEIESITSGKSIESATLKLFVKDNDGNWKDGQLINIHRLDSTWSEGGGVNAPLSKMTGSEKGVTWTCSDNISECNMKWSGGLFSQTPTDSVFISNHVQDGYWIKFDVTQDVKEFLSGQPNHGWVIKKSNEEESGRINFSSREAQSNLPELVLVVSQ